jgi:hypothetical protein
MFEGNGSDSDPLADTDTELYILGIKYKTPNGKSSENKQLRFYSFIKLDTYAVLDDVVSRFWFTYRTGFAPIGK